ncbi:MAG: hypothetical protein AAF628_23305 [Planctomycetota bacterium]
MGRMLLATIGLAPVMVMGECNHELVDTEEYSAIAGDIESGIAGVSAGYLDVRAKRNKAGELPFRIRKGSVTIYNEENGTPGYQAGEDKFIDSKGSDNERPQSSVRIVSLSQSSGGRQGTHWELMIETDTDSNGDGKGDVLRAHSSF